MYVAEQTAIKLAIEFIAEQQDTENIKGRKIAIFSDSLGVLTAMKSANKSQTPLSNEITEIAEQCINEPITLVWIPSHLEIPGNEIADKLAKDGLNNVNIDAKIQVDINDVLSSIDTYINNQWQNRIFR